ncbi:hypothetical protein AB0P37_24485, partial [Streptomyces antimycoticus]
GRSSAAQMLRVATSSAMHSSRRPVTPSSSTAREPSFVPGAIDRMMKVPDAASVAAARALERAIGRKAGGSTGTGLWSALRIVAEMVAAGRTGSVVTLLCDPGERYLDKYYSDAWLEEQGLDIEPYMKTLDIFLATGNWTD